MKGVTHGLFVLSVVVKLFVAIHPCTSLAQGALTEGKNFANSTAGSSEAFGAINGTRGAQVVPNYTTNSAESSYFANGKGVLAAPGAVKSLTCSIALPSTGYAGQDCSAINFLQKRPSGWALNGSNPDVKAVTTSAKDKLANPSAYNGTSSGLSCRSVTRTTEPSFKKEYCTSALSADLQTCRATLQVTVKPVATCPANAIHGPYNQLSSVRAWDALVCDIQTVEKAYRCEAGWIGPFSTRTSVDEWGMPVVTDLGGQFCDRMGEVFSGDSGSTLAIVETRPASTYDRYNQSTVPAIFTQSTSDQWQGTCSTLDERAASNHQPFPDCRRTGVTCLSGPGTRDIGGVAVYRDCWDTEEQYSCRGGPVINYCSKADLAGCTPADTMCRERDAQGQCLLQQTNYACPDQPGGTIQTQVCGPPAACESDPASCFNTSSTPDPDFAKAATAFETQRQSGVYMDSFTLFGGELSSCDIKLFAGISVKSCCAGQGGGAAFTNKNTNAGVAANAAFTVIGEAGKETLRAGTQYVYDALYASTSPQLLNKGLESMKTWGGSLGDGVFNPSFSFYGFSFNFSFANGFEFASFDPMSFAIQVGIALIQEWLKCSDADQKTMIKKGANLCTYVRTECTHRSFGGLGYCTTDTERHCCFNSVLAKIINRQGGAQIARNPSNCGGLSEAEFNSIDFAKIDFSEFIASIGSPPETSGSAASRTASNASRLITNYYSTGAQR